MQKEVTIVPKDKCPLDVLAEMGGRVSNSWIFLHKNAVEKLWITADIIDKFPLIIQMQWAQTPKYPATLLSIINLNEEWFKVSKINATDIAFKIAPSDPEQIFFLKMEE